MSEHTYHTQELVEFVRESNKIEGINRDPLPRELFEFTRFISLDVVTLNDLIKFVKIYQPDALLRNKPSMNVRVGSHIAPAGGANIQTELLLLLRDVNDKHHKGSAYENHQRYEHLHPFLDGNGRSGRALWAWQMNREKKDRYWLERGFLCSWYYQSLDIGGKND